MATRLADVIVPEIFNSYINKEALELNAFYQSGILQRTPVFDAIAAQGGYIGQMPQWDELEGDYKARTDQDTGLPVFDKITTLRENCVKCFDKYQVGAASLASELAGADAMQAISSKVSHKIATLDQKRLLQTLKGVFESANMAANIKDESTSKVTPTMIVDAQGLLGDRQDGVVAIAMHSQVYTALKQKNLIDTIQPSDVAGQPIAMYGQKRIIVDDSLIDNGICLTYLFTSGAVAYGRGGEKYPIEVGKLTHMEEEGITIRKNHIFHVRGTSWIGTSNAMITPDTDLIVGTNWDTAYPNKQISVVLLKTKA